VADGGDDTSLGDSRGDAFRGRDVHCERLLHEHREPLGEDRLFDGTVGERRHAHVHRVQLL
jgi:hypothetical protein